MQGPIRTWCKHGHLIQHMQGHLIAVVSGYTFEASVSGQSEFIEGSIRSRDVVEVVVLTTVVEVVVHGDGSCTHVVVELDGANVLVDVRITGRGT